MPVEKYLFLKNIGLLISAREKISNKECWASTWEPERKRIVFAYADLIKNYMWLNKYKCWNIYWISEVSKYITFIKIFMYFQWNKE